MSLLKDRICGMGITKCEAVLHSMALWFSIDVFGLGEVSGNIFIVGFMLPAGMQRAWGSRAMLLKWIGHSMDISTWFSAAVLGPILSNFPAWMQLCK